MKFLNYFLALMLSFGVFSTKAQFTYGNSAAIKVQDFYIGDDHGAYYTTQNGNDVFMFAEHPTKGYSLVFKGKKNGRSISGTFWTVSKYKSTKYGSVELQVLTNNKLKVIKKGDFPVNELNPSTLNQAIVKQLPGQKDPAFSAYTNSDLDGAFKSDRNTMCYTRQLGSRVVMFCESKLSNGNKPSFAYVFTGSRKGNEVKGTIARVSKGKKKGFGKATFTVNKSSLKSTGDIDLGGSKWIRIFPDYSKSINSYISKLGYNKTSLLETIPSNETGRNRVGSKDFSEKSDEDIFVCSSNSFDLAENFSSIAMMNNQIKDIYPGALVKVNKNFTNGLPNIVKAIPRAQLNLNITRLQGMTGGKNKVQIFSPDKAKFDAAMENRLDWWFNNSYKKGYRSTPEIAYEGMTSWSKEQLAIDLGFKYTWLGGNFKSTFQYTSDKSRKVIYGIYLQTYYEVNTESPPKPSGWFSTKATLTQVKQNFTTKAPLAYVSNVKYGRIIIVRFETSVNNSTSDFDAAFDYIFKGKINASVKAKFNKEVQKKSVKIYMNGGSHKQFEAFSLTGSNPIDELRKSVKAGLSFNKGIGAVPIAYSVKFVKDNAPAFIGGSTQYSTLSCKKVNPYIKFEQEGWYAARFSIWYDYKGERKKWHSNKRAKDWSEIIRLPAGAKNIDVKVEFWNVGWKTIYNGKGEFGKVYRSVGKTWSADVRVNNLNQ